MALRSAIKQWSIPALVAGMLVSCSNDLDNVAAIDMGQGSPDRVTQQAEYIYTDSGRVRYRLRAGRIAEWALEPKRTEITEGLELVFFDSAGAEGSVLTARRGVILPGQKRMEAYEQVVFVNTKGERLETEEVIWYQDSAKIFTDKAVRIQRGGDVIHGQGLVAAEDFSKYSVRRITGTLRIASDDTLAAQ